jgi:hypothetical protein
MCCIADPAFGFFCSGSIPFASIHSFTIPFIAATPVSSPSYPFPFLTRTFSTPLDTLRLRPLSPFHSPCPVSLFLSLARIPSIPRIPALASPSFIVLDPFPPPPPFPSIGPPFLCSTSSPPSYQSPPSFVSVCLSASFVLTTIVKLITHRLFAECPLTNEGLEPRQLLLVVGRACRTSETTRELPATACHRPFPGR